MRFLNVLRLMPLAAVVACSGIFDVKAPDVVTPEKLESASGAKLLMNGAIYRMNLVSPYLLYYADVMSDQYSTAFTTDFLDQRVHSEVLNSSVVIGGYVYTQAQFMRVEATQAIPPMRQFVNESSGPTRAQIGRMYTIRGYGELLMGEMMCSGLPLSSAVVGTLKMGPPVSRDSMLKVAVSDFDSAFTAGVGDSARLGNMAKVLKGRALLDLDQPAAAAAAVAGVPTNFNFMTDFSTTTTSNFPGYYPGYGYATVPDREGINGLPYVSANDPRVPLTPITTGVVYASGVPLNPRPYAYTPYYAGYQVTSYKNFSLISGVEARLIEAEAALRAGDNAGSLAILNSLRATAAPIWGTTALNMAPLTDAGSPDARVDQLFYERAFWLFLTGHRLGDMRRLVRFYKRSVDKVFPTGPWLNHPGQNYGQGVSLSADAAELNNPNWAGTTCDTRIP